MISSAANTVPARNVLLRIAPFTLIIFFAYLTVGLPLAALPLQVHDVLGFDNLIVGVTIGVQALVTLLTRQFAGVLCDRRGAKFGVVAGSGVAIAASAIYLVSAVAPLSPVASLALLLAARVISGLAESLIMTGALAWGIGAVGVENAGRVMVWVGIGLYTAIAAGAPIGVALMKEPGGTGGFAAVSLGMIVVSVLAVAAASLTPGVAPLGGERMPFGKVIGRIAPFGAGLALATLAFGAIGAFGALDFEHKGWPGSGFALTGYGVAYVFTRLVFGGWPDRFGGARVAAWSLLIECIGQLMMWLAPHPALAFAGTALTGAGNALVFPAFGVEAVKRVPPASRGAALGAYVACFDVGFGLAGPTTGLMAGAFGYPSVFALGAFGAAAAIVVAWRSLANARSAPH
jgi:MFS family permease